MVSKLINDLKDVGARVDHVKKNIYDGVTAFELGICKSELEEALRILSGFIRELEKQQKEEKSELPSDS